MSYMKVKVFDSAKSDIEDIRATLKEYGKVPSNKFCNITTAVLRSDKLAMKKITSLDQLNIPTHYKGFLTHFLYNVSKVDYVSRVILFGSCARGQMQDRSDIDLLVITNDGISLEDEFHIMNDCAPNGEDQFYVPADIIVDPIGNYERFRHSIGMMQRAVEREGVDLSELLR